MYKYFYYCVIYRSMNDVLSSDTIDDNINLETGVSNSEPMSPTLRSRSESFYSVNSRRSTYYSMAGSSYLSVCDQPGGKNCSHEK